MGRAVGGTIEEDKETGAEAQEEGGMKEIAKTYNVSAPILSPPSDLSGCIRCACA